MSSPHPTIHASVGKHGQALSFPFLFWSMLQLVTIDRKIISECSLSISKLFSGDLDFGEVGMC